MAGVLEGIRVISMGQAVAVPAAGATLGDWGAEVIKVEPLHGELTRGLRRIRGVDTRAAGEFHLENRNKKGLAVDLKKESGRDILYKLVQKSDVFMSNYQLSALKGLKLDYITLSQLNPRLVYAVLSGYGSRGPDKDERGFDHAAAWARSGTQYLIGEPGRPPPPQLGGQMDRVTAGHVVSGILASLLYRERTGKGQELEFSLYHTGVWTLASQIQAALAGSPLPRHERLKASNPLYNTYRAKDGGWFQLVMLQSDLQWPDFCRAIERPELENDPLFKDMDARAENCEELIGILDELFATKDSREWERRLKENNCIYGRVATPEEVITDPQALANDFFAEVSHPELGEMKLVTTPVTFRQNPASIRTLAPEIGQHTEEILLDLGYNWDDIAQLKKQGVIL